MLLGEDENAATLNKPVTIDMSIDRYAADLAACDCGWR
jgi:hypothetical protein